MRPPWLLLGSVFFAARAAVILFNIGSGRPSWTVSQLVWARAATPADGSLPLSQVVRARAATPANESLRLPAHPKGRQARNTDALLTGYSRFADPKASSGWAFFHMLNLRNALSVYGGCGSIFDHPTEWTHLFHYTERAFLEWRAMHAGRPPSEFRFCEVGLGPGFSSLAALTAMTAPSPGGATADADSWRTGGTLVEFDLGPDTRDCYYDARRASIRYHAKFFGAPGSSEGGKHAVGKVLRNGRVEYHFGSSPRTVRDARSFPKGTKCHAVHVDGLHSASGVYEDIKSLWDGHVFFQGEEVPGVSPPTVLFLDDLNIEGVWQGVQRAVREGMIRLELKVQETGKADFVSSSLWDGSPNFAPGKTYARAVFLRR